MPEDIYRRLAKHLDNLPGGFPATESGVELRLLKRLFTEEEAQTALLLTLIPEEARVVARRAGKTTGEMRPFLREMAKKGLIYSIELGEEKEPLFMASHFVVGIWEYQVNRLSPELVADMREYIPHLFQHKVWEKGAQLRTIPVGRSLDGQSKVLPHEEIEKIVRRQKKILVAPCICRTEHHLTGEGCEKPVESCLVFGGGADFYHRAGIGRFIGQEECLEIIKKADKAGLVLQPSNSQKVINVCACCGCCCQVLKSLKKHPQPASLVTAPFIVQFTGDDCKKCGVCVKRCQMEAITLEDDRLTIDLDRCIGCGLCVSTCPTKSLVMVRKPEEEQKPVPGSIVQTYLNLGRTRGKLKPAGLAWMALKSKLDRLLASR